MFQNTKAYKPTTKRHASGKGNRTPEPTGSSASLVNLKGHGCDVKNLSHDQSSYQFIPVHRFHTPVVMIRNICTSSINYHGFCVAFHIPIVSYIVGYKFPLNPHEYQIIATPK